MLKEYDIVLAKRDLSKMVSEGTKGALMLTMHNNPNKYEVEFVDENGITLELLTVDEDDLELIEG